MPSTKGDHKIPWDQCSLLLLALSDITFHLRAFIWRRQGLSLTSSACSTMLSMPCHTETEPMSTQRQQDLSAGHAKDGKLDLWRAEQGPCCSAAAQARERVNN